MNSAHSHERLADERTRDKERKTKETGTPHVNTAVSAPHQTNSDRGEQTHTHNIVSHHNCSTTVRSKHLRPHEKARDSKSDLNLEDLEFWNIYKQRHIVTLLSVDHMTLWTDSQIAFFHSMSNHARDIYLIFVIQNAIRLKNACTVTHTYLNCARTHTQPSWGQKSSNIWGLCLASHQKAKQNLARKYEHI